jgi:hypothetical protein
MDLTFKHQKDCKHSKVFAVVADQTYQDGERVLPELKFTVYVPNDVLAAIGHSRGDVLAFQIKVK